MANFAERVAAAVAATGPLCAGIDPSADVLSAWGLGDDAGGLRQFGARCLEAFSGTVGVVKPQVAFYERHGAAGFAALEELLAEARAAGFVVVADAKRGDIANSAEGYARAWLDPQSPLAADAVTAVAYMGLGSLAPLVETARVAGRGVIVVARSSNPEGRSLQEATVAGGGSVEDRLLAEIAELNASHAPGTVGAVVGATLSPSAFPLARLGGVILAPGVGAQGATAAAVGKLFGGCPPGSVLPNVSRSVLSAGPSVDSLRAACRRARDELAEVLV
ncbi:MAG: orotidine-5'-phosphate decarboxylase [Acidimicrobiales bacterium]